MAPERMGRRSPPEQLQKLLVQVTALQAALGTSGVSQTSGNGQQSSSGSCGSQESRSNGQPGEKPDGKDGWKSVTKNRQKVESDATPKKDALEAEGWSVAVVTDLLSAAVDASGVGLATAGEAKQLVKEKMGGAGALAVLSPITIDGTTSEEVPILVKDKDGRVQVGRRHLVQLGATPVTFAPPGKKVTGIASDTKKVVLTMSKEHAVSASWAATLKAPSASAYRWLRHRANVDVLDTQPPTRKDAESVQVVTNVTNCSYTKTLAQVDSIGFSHGLSTATTRIARSSAPSSCQASQLRRCTASRCPWEKRRLASCQHARGMNSEYSLQTSRRWQRSCAQTPSRRLWARSGRCQDFPCHGARKRSSVCWQVGQ